MVDDNAPSQADAALVRFGLFDWIDRSQLQVPDLYEQRLQFLEYADEAGFYGIVRHVYVAETDAQSLQEARAAFADFIYNFNYLRTVNGDTSGRAAYLADFDARLADGLHVVGSPNTVKQRVQEHLQITGSNYFVGSFFFGTLTSEQTLRSMRLFAEEVMPACHHIG